MTVVVMVVVVVFLVGWRITTRKIINTSTIIATSTGATIDISRSSPHRRGVPGVVRVAVHKIIIDIGDILQRAPVGSCA